LLTEAPLLYSKNVFWASLGSHALVQRYIF
jgi:hypothetical protein